MLDDQDGLALWNPDSRDVELVDDDVFPGFGFSHDGHLLAYSTGEGPAMSAWLFDTQSSLRHPLDTHPPVWGFVFSPDDRRIAFVDSPEGFPCLATMTVDGSDHRRWTQRGTTLADVRAGTLLSPFPDGRRPPPWTTAGLFVESSASVALIDEQGIVVETWPAASELHAGTAADSVIVRDGTKVYRRIR